MTYFPIKLPIGNMLRSAFNGSPSFGYREIRFPILEQTQLFKRSIGEVTDIVEKEMYSFDDRNGDNLESAARGHCRLCARRRSAWIALQSAAATLVSGSNVSP